MAAITHHAGRLYTGTNAERGGLATASFPPGVEFIESDTQKIYEWDGVAWKQLDAAVGPVFAADVFLDDGVGDSPALHFVGASNEEAILHFDDTARSLVITLEDNKAEALRIIDDGDGDIYFKITTTTGSEAVIFNEGGDDVDFRVEGVGGVNALFVRGSDGSVGVGTAAPATTLHVVNVLDAANVLIFKLEGQRANPANNDTVYIDYTLYNSTPASFEYARTTITAEDITATEEDGSLLFEVARNGTLETVLKMSATEIVANEPGADRDFRVEAVGVIDALSIQGSDGQITLGVLGAGIVQSTVGGVLSSDYTIDGTLTMATGLDIDPIDASGQDLGDATHRWDLYTQDVIFGGATGANIVTIPDNLADALHITDDGDADIYLKIITTTGSEAVVINAGEDDVDVVISTAGATNAFATRGDNGYIGFGIRTPLYPVHAYGAGAAHVQYTAQNANSGFGAIVSVINDVPAGCELILYGSTAAGAVRYGLARAGNAFFSTNAGAFGIGTSSASVLVLGTNNTERARISAAGRVSIGGVAAPLAQLHVDQFSGTGAIPVMYLDQGDADEPFTNYVGTAAANATASISTWTTGSSVLGHLQIEVNGVKRWLRIYDDPTG